MSLQLQITPTLLARINGQFAAGSAAPTSEPAQQESPAASAPATVDAQWSALAQAILEAGPFADMPTQLIAKMLAQSGADALLTQIFSSSSLPGKNENEASESPPLPGKTPPAQAAAVNLAVNPAGLQLIATRILHGLGIQTPSVVATDPPATRTQGQVDRPPLVASELSPAISQTSEPTRAKILSSTLRDLVARTILNLVTQGPAQASHPSQLAQASEGAQPAQATATAGLYILGVPTEKAADGKASAPFEIKRALAKLAEAFEGPEGKDLGLRVLNAAILRGTPHLLNRLLFASDQALNLEEASEVSSPVPGQPQASAAGSVSTAAGSDLQSAAPFKEESGEHAIAKNINGTAEHIKLLTPLLTALLKVATPSASNQIKALFAFAQQPQSPASTSSPQIAPTVLLQTGHGFALEIEAVPGRELKQLLTRLDEEGIETEIIRNPEKPTVQLRIEIPQEKIEDHTLAFQDDTRPKTQEKPEANAPPRPLHDKIVQFKPDPPHANEAALLAASRADSASSSPLEQLTDRPAQHNHARENTDLPGARPDLLPDGRFAPYGYQGAQSAASTFAFEPSRVNSTKPGHEPGNGLPEKKSHPLPLLLTYKRIEVIAPIFTYDDDYKPGPWPQSSVRPPREHVPFTTDGSDLEVIPV